MFDLIGNIFFKMDLILVYLNHQASSFLAVISIDPNSAMTDLSDWPHDRQPDFDFFTMACAMTGSSS